MKVKCESMQSCVSWGGPNVWKPDRDVNNNASKCTRATTKLYENENQTMSTKVMTDKGQDVATQGAKLATCNHANEDLLKFEVDCLRSRFGKLRYPRAKLRHRELQSYEGLENV